MLRPEIQAEFNTINGSLGVRREIVDMGIPEIDRMRPWYDLLEYAVARFWIDGRNQVAAEVQKVLAHEQSIEAAVENIVRAHQLALDELAKKK